MRNAIVSCCIFVLMIICIIFSQVALKKTCKEMSDMAESIYKSIEEEQWSKAKAYSEKLKDLWEVDSKWVSMLVDHSEIDLIIKAIASLNEYVKYEKMPQVMAELKTLIKIIEHIPDKEKMSMGNIL